MTKSRYLPSRRAALMQLGALAIPGGALLALTPKAAADNVPSDPLVGRRIVFDDDFASLDWTRWNAGPKATTAPSGFYGRSAFAQKGGDEGFNPYSIVDDPRVANGKALQIACSYIGRPMHIRNYYGNDLPEFQWVSGNMQGATPQGVLLNGWRSGYFEARMQLPMADIDGDHMVCAVVEEDFGKAAGRGADIETVAAFRAKAGNAPAPPSASARRATHRPAPDRGPRLRLPRT